MSNSFDLFGMDDQYDGFGDIQMQYEEDQEIYDSDCETESVKSAGITHIMNIVQPTHSDQTELIQKSEKHEEDNGDECYEALKVIAQYMIEGMEELQKTYEFGNAVFALEYYKKLLQAGIEGTYKQEMLPKHLKDFTSQNFLDNDKIKGLWKNDDIISIARLFKLCFGPEKKTPSAIKAYRAAIESMLNDRDNIFKQMISSTNNA